MDTQKEQKYNEERNEILKEIQYREYIMRQLNFDQGRKSCFVVNFIYTILGFKEPKAPFYRTEKYGKPIYKIDSDINLQKDIYDAFEKSKNRLIEVYNLIEKQS